MTELPYKLLIFDWDGTLMDSEARIVNCLRASCEEHGFTSPPDEQLKDVIGLGLREALIKLHPNETNSVIEKLAEAYPDAIKIIVILDNLNTHDARAFYEFFDAETAAWLTEKIEFVFTGGDLVIS